MEKITVEDADPLDEGLKRLEKLLSNLPRFHNVAQNTFKTGGVAIAAIVLAGVSSCISIVCVVALAVITNQQNTLLTTTLEQQNLNIAKIEKKQEDNQAWVGVYGNDIAYLKAKLQETKK